MGARGVRQGNNSGFFNEAGRLVGIDTSRPGWRRQLAVEDPGILDRLGAGNLDRGESFAQRLDNFLSGVASGHFVARQGGGYFDPDRTSGASWDDVDWEAQQRNLGQAASGAYDGSGGGAGGDNGSGPGDAGTGGDNNPIAFGDRITNLISSIMSGETAPYSDEAVRALRASAFEDAAGGVSAANRATAARAQRGGGLYSASAGSEAAENERSGRTAYSAASRDIESTAAKENFGARVQGLQQALALQQQEMEERLANARNATDRARIETEYRGLMDSTRERIASEERMAEQAANAAARAGGSSQNFAREMAELDWEHELNRRAYEEPFRIAQFGSQFGEE